jgi:hypothetical protein
MQDVTLFHGVLLSRVLKQLVVEPHRRLVAAAYGLPVSSPAPMAMHPLSRFPVGCFVDMREGTTTCNIDMTYSPKRILLSVPKAL